VGDLLHILGIDFKILVPQAIGFLIVLFILRKFAFGRISALLANRRNDIANRLNTLESQQQELDQIRADAQRRLDEIEAESQARIQSAIDEANAERENIIAQTRQEASQIIEDARAEIQQQKEVAISELRSTVADLAIAAAEKILEVELDEERHRNLIDAQLSELG